ncbi:MAG: galactokinase [Candidatus Aminicenantes bacterium RBG_13_63_10]|nr:MAG: galactokinase [Candidatus Aminicenantes bacterium RBG_13_63_10]
MPDPVAAVQAEFVRRFCETPLLVRSPGRVNLIGEHTDYNEGFVLPAAVDKAIYFGLSPRTDGRCELYALDLKDSYRTELDRLEKSGKRWPDYLLGVVDQVQKAGHAVPGFNCVFGGDVPIGSGMSSSAAIEAGLAFALNTLFGLDIPPLDLVKLAQKAENEFVGVRCGIMDQFVNIFGRAGHVLKLDCRSLVHTYYPFDRRDLRIVLCDTKVKRELASSEYNVRRRQCEEGVSVLAQYRPGVKSLRDATPELLERHKSEFDPLIYKRCFYVVQENERVGEACRDLERSDFVSFGQRMNASHSGLRDDYQVSSVELDILVEAAQGVKGVLGSRMMGAGFGGCTINLVEETAVEALVEAATRAYRDKMKTDPKAFISRLSAGTEVLAPEG